MSHVHDNAKVRETLTVQRDRMQGLIQQIDSGADCAHILSEVVTSYKALGALATEPAVEHLSEHIAEVDEQKERLQGAKELEGFLRSVVVGAE